MVSTPWWSTCSSQAFDVAHTGFGRVGNRPAASDHCSISWWSVLLAMPLRQVVLLQTSSPRNIMQQLAQRRVLDVLVGKHIDVELVDGARKSISQQYFHAQLRLRSTPLVHATTLRGPSGDKARREELLECDGATRASYPQLFLHCLAAGVDSYAADLDTFERAVECSGLPADVLRSHPEIQTFESIFYDVAYVGWRASQRAAQQKLWLVAGAQHDRLGSGSPMYILSLDIVAMVAALIPATPAPETVADADGNTAEAAPREVERSPYGSRVVL